MTNDTIVTLQDCSTHQTGETTWSASILTGYALTGWAIFANGDNINKPDAFGLTCGNTTGNSYATKSMTSTTAANNFAANSFDALRHVFQPANRGNGPNGQPWNVYYRLHSLYTQNEENGDMSGVWGVFYEP